MRTTYSLMALAGLVLLAACDTKTSDEAQPGNEVTEVPVQEPAKPALNEQRETNVAMAPANVMEPPSISEEQQMLDDADATGLTSRLPDDNTSLPPASGGGSGSAPPP